MHIFAGVDSQIINPILLEELKVLGRQLELEQRGLDGGCGHYRPLGIHPWSALWSAGLGCRPPPLSGVRGGEGIISGANPACRSNDSRAICTAPDRGRKHAVLFWKGGRLEGRLR